jgi:hypothetical protein
MYLAGDAVKRSVVVEKFAMHLLVSVERKGLQDVNHPNENLRLRKVVLKDVNNPNENLRLRKDVLIVYILRKKKTTFRNRQIKTSK